MYIYENFMTGHGLGHPKKGAKNRTGPDFKALVEVDCDENVGGLKKAIKEEVKPAFDHITANSLDIWNVSIPIHEDTNLQAKVNGLRLHEKKPLWALKGLLRIFGDLESLTLFLLLFTFFLFPVCKPMLVPL